MSLYHKHHIIPKHIGGTDNPSNIVELTIEQHAEAHKKLWEQYKNEKDRIAWLALAGQITFAKANRLALIDTNRKVQTQRFHEGNHPFVGLSEKRVKNGTHHFLNSKVQSQINYNKVKKGTHPFSRKNMKLYNCKYCNKKYDIGNFIQWHGEKCKYATKC